MKRTTTAPEFALHRITRAAVAAFTASSLLWVAGAHAQTSTPTEPVPVSGDTSSTGSSGGSISGGGESGLTTTLRSTDGTRSATGLGGESALDSTRNRPITPPPPPPPPAPAPPPPPPADCVIAAGTSRTWMAGGQTCNAITAAGTIASGSSRSFMDSTAPTTGSASFLCTNGVLAAAASAGATCAAPPPPADCAITAGTSRTWTVGGAMCDATSTAVTIPSGSTRTFTDSTAPTTGSATYSCTNGVLSSTESAGATCTAPPPPASCSIAAGTSRSWTVGSFTCSDTNPAATIAHGATLSFSDATAPSVGSATYTCNDGVLSATANAGATCAAASCSVPASTVRSWTVGGLTCTDASATTATTVAHGATLAFSDVAAPSLGSASFACNNGSLSATPNSGATCAAASCSVPANTARTWTVGGYSCTDTSATTATTVAHGASLAFSDAAAPNLGSAGYACNNGTLATTANAGATCAPASCTVASGAARTWTVGSYTCSDTTAAATVAHGATLAFSDSASPSTGSATYACNNGTLSATPSSSSCVAASCVIPYNTSRSWTVGGSSCTATSAASGSVTIAPGATRTFTDSVAPRTGAAAFECSNGTLLSTPEAGATCRDPSTAAAPSPSRYDDSSGCENAIWGAFQRDMSATPPVGYYQRSKARFGFGSSTSVAVLLKHHYQWNGSAWIFTSEEIINIQSGNPMCP